MSLFKKGAFTSHAGLELMWKVECDAMTSEDWATLAYLVARTFRFRSVVGVPEGGVKFAKALWPYLKHDAPADLIVDDVWTTGQSMREARQHLRTTNTLGIVVFARGHVDNDWVRPMWTAASWMHF